MFWCVFINFVYFSCFCIDRKLKRCKFVYVCKCGFYLVVVAPPPPPVVVVVFDLRATAA